MCIDDDDKSNINDNSHFILKINILAGDWRQRKHYLSAGYTSTSSNSFPHCVGIKAHIIDRKRNISVGRENETKIKEQVDSIKKI